MTRIIKRLVIAAIALVAIGGAVVTASAVSSLSAEPTQVVPLADHEWL